MNGPVRWLLDPGSADGGWRIVPRLVLAALILPAGLGKFVNHDAYVERFDRWGFGAPGAFVIVAGIAEVGASLLVLLGIAPRLGAAGVVGVMIGALATAGRIEGGQHIWLPLIIIALAIAVAVTGSGPWRVRIPPTRRPDALEHG